MAWEYSKKRPADKSFDPECCKASVSHGWGHDNQCSRKVWKDGWCRQHHPDSERARSEKRLKRCTNIPLVRATQRIAELEKWAKTSLYIPSELFLVFVSFLKSATNDVLLDFGDTLEADEIKVAELIIAFCEQHQEAN